MADDKTKCSSFGWVNCLSYVILVFISWAWLFGVTVGGKHYDISCSCSRGVGVYGR